MTTYEKLSPLPPAVAAEYLYQRRYERLHGTHIEDQIVTPPAANPLKACWRNLVALKERVLLQG